MEREERDSLEKLKVAHARGLALRDSHIQRSKLTNLNQIEERKEDKVLLAYNMEKEKQAIAAEDQKKLDELKKFQQLSIYNNMYVAKEQEDQAALEKMFKAEEDKRLDARDAEQRRREEQRKALYSDV